MSVSVVICTYNRAQLLKQTLDSLALQTVGPEQFEIVVVDDGSVDETPEVCHQMRQDLPHIKYLSNEVNLGIGCSRNRGIRSVEGEFILFTDDDCIANKDWVERMSAALEKESVVAGAVESPELDYVRLCHNIAEFHPFMPGRKPGKVEFIAGANMGFRRSVLDELGGFNEKVKTAEDMEFILRIRSRGYRIYLARDAVVSHEHDRGTLGSVFGYSARHASTTILLRNKYRSLLGTPFVLRSPFLTVMAAPVIALKVTLGIYMHNPRLAKLFWTVPMVYALKLAWCWGAARGLRANKRAKVIER
jgi:GT2 family glycosyltransferase